MPHLGRAPRRIARVSKDGQKARPSRRPSLETALRAPQQDEVSGFTLSPPDPIGFEDPSTKVVASYWHFPPDRFYANQKSMKKSVSAKQKRRGRPATGVTPMIGLRLPAKVTTQVDRWAEINGVTRSQAIRSLIEQALSGSSSGQRSPKARSKAQELASAQLDKLIDVSAPDEEQQQRKRRLLKGPKEFREMRDKIRSSK